MHHAIHIKLKSSRSTESHSPLERLKTYFGTTHFSHYSQRQSRCCQTLGFCSGNGSLISAKHSGRDNSCHGRH